MFFVGVRHCGPKVERERMGVILGTPETVAKTTMLGYSHRVTLTALFFGNWFLYQCTIVALMLLAMIGSSITI